LFLSRRLRLNYVCFAERFVLSERPTYQELFNSVESLIKRVSELEVYVVENKRLRRGNTQLTKRIVKLEDKVRQLQVSKNSSNSSIPPSKDENGPKPNQSLRKSTGKKPGGQKGRIGKTLEMTLSPDKTIELKPEFCNKCGESLEGQNSTKEKVRQIVDIPPIKAVFTEYQTFSKTCGCGCKTIADFPKEVNSPVSYGQNIEGLIAYFHARQYLPFSRMQEVFNDVFNIDISEGGIHYLLNRFARKTKPIYQTIKERVASSKVIGTDETGVKVNGEKHWFWTWQTPKLTFITHSKNRGSDTINEHFPQGFPNSTLVHDRWAAQFKTKAKHHQSCIPHIQRRLNYLNEKYTNSWWVQSFIKLLGNSLRLKKNEKQFNQQRTEIIKKLTLLLDKPPEKEKKELFAFYKGMLKHKQHLFTFLFIDEVPADNNASERAIRNIKVKQKISGQFKSIVSAQVFAQIRSVIDTIIKNNLNVCVGLNSIAQQQLQFDNN